MPAKKSKRKKILLLARSLDIQSAGIHVYTKNLISHLEKYGDHNSFEYTIVRAGKKIDLPLVFIKEHTIENKFNLPLFDSFRLFFFVPFYAIFKAFDIVIELSHFGPFNLPKKIKRITVIHDLTPIIHSEFHVFSSSILQKIFLPRILKKADLIIANSLNTQNDIRNVYPNITTEISTIPLGLDNKFIPILSKNLNSLAQYGINNKYILYLGTIEPRKNLIILLKAYEHFRRNTNSDIQLVLAGKVGWKSEEFFAQLKSSSYQKDINLIGYVEDKDLPTIYANCDVFVYPSIYEGFGLPVVEALSSGAQVICAENSSLIEFGKELVTYFDTNNPIDLAEKLEQILVEKKTKKLNLLKLKEKYSWKSYVTKLEKILNHF